MLLRLASRHGATPTVLDTVRLMRSEHSIPRCPVLYEPSVVIIAAGRKRGYIGDRSFVYDANNYLVLSVPLPFECETEMGENEPMLGVSVRMEMSTISELALQLEARRQPAVPEPDVCVRATPLDMKLSDAVVRLLECLESPTDAGVLGPAIVREIAYRVLCGPQASVLLAMLGRNGQMAQIHAALHRIHMRYAEPLNVPQMADDAGMSVSAFHHHFKAVTASSPLQYLKSVRLHKARLLIAQHGLGAAVAADRVGYESPSQFSREFKRFFGTTPVSELRRARESRM